MTPITEEWIAQTLPTLSKPERKGLRVWHTHRNLADPESLTPRVCGWSPDQRWALLAAVADEEQADAYRDASQHEGPILSTFLDWLDEKGYAVGVRSDTYTGIELAHISRGQLIADHLGIDLAAVERHRSRVLAEHRRKYGPEDAP